MNHSALSHYKNSTLKNFTHLWLSENHGQNPDYQDLEFVYDRTAQDVEYVKELNQKYLNRTITEGEKEVWFGNLKGALNLSDINRVENNTRAIAKLANVLVNTKLWLQGEIPTESDYGRIRENVETLKESTIGLHDSPEIPERPFNTYQKWNDIEKILFDVYYFYQKSVGYFCGSEIYAGEGVGIL